MAHTDFEDYIKCNEVEQQPEAIFLAESPGGNINLIGDYSVTPGYFYIMPPENEVWLIERMMIMIQDTGQVAGAKYGGITALTNGIRLEVRIGDNVEYDFLAGDVIKTNADWNTHCHNVVPVVYGPGDDYISGRWTFKKHGRPLVLRGQLAERLTMIVSDNLTGLLSHKFNCQGVKVAHQEFQGYDAHAPSTRKSFIEPA